MNTSESAETAYLEKAAQRGNPSFVWRAGQERRLNMIRAAAGERLLGRVLEDGCGVGMYLGRLAEKARQADRAGHRVGAHAGGTPEGRAGRVWCRGMAALP